MTNPTKETLELVLEVAREAFVQAEIKRDQVFVSNTVKIWTLMDLYEPHLNTERGKTQLMDLVRRMSNQISGNQAIWLMSCIQAGNVDEILKLYLQVNKGASCD